MISWAPEEEYRHQFKLSYISFLGREAFTPLHKMQSAYSKPYQLRWLPNGKMDWKIIVINYSLN